MEVLEITDLTVEGFGVAKQSGLVYFVKGIVAPGDVVRAVVTSQRKNYAEAELVELVQASPYRIEPLCPHFSQCGGCQLQHISYQEQLQWKSNFASQNLWKLAREKVDNVHIVPSDLLYGYRAKAHFTFGEENDILNIGYFSKSDKWFALTTCPILKETLWVTAQDVLSVLRKHDLKSYFTSNGTLRHLQVRVSLLTGEKQVLVTFTQFPKNFENVAEEILSAGISSLALHQNTAQNKTVIGKGATLYNGNQYVQEQLMGKVYNITPVSFFQINPVQAEKLFSIALDYLEPQPEDIVFEGYSGVGAFTLLYAQKVKTVIAAEGVEEAVQQACKNAALNNVDNVQFLAKPVEEAAGSLQQKINKVVVDPPRNGMTQEALNAVARLQPERIVYISCDPSTLARDISRFQPFGYSLNHIQAIDMFPQTTHVECVALLIKEKL